MNFFCITKNTLFYQPSTKKSPNYIILSTKVTYYSLKLKHLPLFRIRTNNKLLMFIIIYKSSHLEKKKRKREDLLY